MWLYVKDRCTLLENISKESEKSIAFFSESFMTNLSSKLSALLLLVLTFTFASCGKQKPMVTDLKVKPVYEGSDLAIALSANLSIGNVQLPSASIPIYMPKTWREIGAVEMVTIKPGQNFLKVKLNMSKIAQLEAKQSTLPNGGLLPLIGENKTIVIPVAKKVNIYVSFGDGIAALGVAIPFKTLDGLGAKVGTTNLFPVFNIGKVFGSAGLYTSKTAGQNGFALFADLTNVLDPVHFIELGSPEQTLKSINYNAQAPSRRTKKRIDREMYKLHKGRKRLSLY